MCFPSAAFPSSRDNGWFSIRARRASEFTEEAPNASARKWKLMREAFYKRAPAKETFQFAAGSPARFQSGVPWESRRLCLLPPAAGAVAPPVKNWSTCTAPAITRPSSCWISMSTVVNDSRSVPRRRRRAA